MPEYTTILFDLDGTLTDSKDGIVRSLRYALRKLGLPEERDGGFECMIGPPLLESFQKYYGLADAEARRATACYREYYAEQGIFENRVYAGIPELLTALRAARLRLFVATAKPEAYAERILAHFGLDAHFERVFGAQLDGRLTAKPDLLRHALANITSCERKATVMVGDREHDINGAHANGLDCIAVAYGYGPPAELAAARPEFMAGTVAELQDLLLDSALPQTNRE